MTDGGPFEYDREWTTSAPGPTPTRVRTGLSTRTGDVTAFVVQLEYRHGGEWQPVVRYDHNPQTAEGHDVRRDGLHIEVYRDGRRVRRRQLTAPIPPDRALTRAEEHLRQHVRRYITRYERWHGIRSGP
ncbi:hypothetical protein BRD10_00620 [Halobacteriales archaeon SW_12_71_31]|nr:MAG: hypothetical protein BRD10_00620 [Halobacteriales archaeon SW_12_71_31]